MTTRVVLVSIAAFPLAACGGSSDASVVATDEVAVISESLAPFGDGYPNAGDACIRLGESAATSNYLDDSALLVGCPSEASAEALDGDIVGNIDGVRLVSIPMRESSMGMSEGGPPIVGEMPDFVDPMTGFNATAMVPCGFEGFAPTINCDAGVKRDLGEDGITLVEVTKPDGRKRTIFFRGTTPYRADSGQADGSVGWDFSTSRKGDEVTIKYGPETYIVVDAFVEGG